MSGWSILPWRTMRDAASVEAATSMIEAIGHALRSTSHDAWHEGNPATGAWACWTSTDHDDEDVEIAIHAAVEHPRGGLCTIDVHIEHGTTARTATVMCDPSLVDHLREDPTRILGLVSKLLEGAVRTRDETPTTKRRRIDHEDLDEQDAIAIVRQTEDAGMNPSSAIRVESWGASPLSPARTRTIGCGMERMETTDGAPASFVRLSAHPERGVRLTPLVSTVQSDGFDPMQLLRIHRRMITT